MMHACVLHLPGSQFLPEFKHERALAASATNDGDDVVAVAVAHSSSDPRMYEAVPMLLLAHSSAFAAAHEAALHAQLASLLASRASESETKADDGDDFKENDQL